MKSTIMGYRGTTIRIHSFIPSQPKGAWGFRWGITMYVPLPNAAKKFYTGGLGVYKGFVRLIWGNYLAGISLEQQLTTSTVRTPIHTVISTR